MGRSRRTDGKSVFSKSWGIVAREYMENSTIAGCKQIVEPGRHPIERFIWLMALIASIVGVIYLVLSIWSSLVEKPTIVSKESSQYPIWTVPFPGIALCNVNKISKKKATQYANYLATKTKGLSEENLLSFIRYFGRMLDHDIDGHEDFMWFMDYLFLHDTNKTTEVYDILGTMKMLSPQCSDLLVRCKWMGDILDCNKIFQTRRTMEGFCCTFNYRKSIDPMGFEGDDNMEPLTLPAAAQPFGLSVIMNPQLEDYFYTMHSSEGIDVYIFNPDDYPDVTSGALVYKFVEVNSEMLMNLEPRTVKSVPDVKSFSFAQRGCMFHDDLPETYGGHYSYSNCLMKCRMKSILALCKCVPYYMPVYKDDIHCTLHNVPCLNKFREMFRTFYTGETEEEGLEEEWISALFCTECLPDCSTTMYRVHATATPIYNSTSVQDYRYGLNLENHSILHIYYGDVDTELYKLDVLYYWFEIISNFGGICGLFVGFSIVSVIELLYYFTIRLVQVMHQNGFRICRR